jgi:hypothetical protein
MTDPNPLFLTRSYQGETSKVAGTEVRLPEDPAQWQVEILQELYKQVPYVSDFSPRIVLDRVDNQRMVGFGNIEVSNKTQIQVSDPKTLETAGINEIRIPIVIRGGRLCPLDLLVTADSRIMPLTERRMRQELFRPELFDTTSRSPGDMSMISQLYPPYRQNYGIGGGGMSMGTGMGKEGSARGSLLETLLPRATNVELSKVASAMFADYQVGQSLLANPATAHPAHAIQRYLQDGGCQDKTASTHLDEHPTVMQIQASGPGLYLVKTANHRAWAPSEVLVTWQQLREVFGEKVARAVDAEGPTTLVRGAGAEEADVEAPELITRPGIYHCARIDGTEVIGQVFPSLEDLPSGKSLPIAMFTNGQATSVQPEIIGTLVSTDTPLLQPRKPQGVGYFTCNAGSTPVATIPMTIHGEFSEGNEFVMAAETYDGRNFRVTQDPTVRMISDAGDGMVVIPASYTWVSLEQAQAITLAGADQSSADTKKKEASAYVAIRADASGVVDLVGTPLDSIRKHAQLRQLSADDAVFVLAGLGVDPTVSYTKIAQSMALGQECTVMAHRELVSAEDFAKEAAETNAAIETFVGTLRADLTKEAAFVDDPLSVDTLLSIGFINPENVSTFIAYLPKVDETQERLCDLLLASRVGLKQIPTQAVERAIKAVEAVIEGLRVLAFQEEPGA